MTDGSLAISTMPPALPADADYDALCEALMASARGRWFLEEYAKRNRNADTGLVLDAVARVEAVVRSEQAHQASQGMRIELLEMARTIAQTRADVAEARPERSPAAPGTDVFAAAGRLQDVAWTMRERGLDMAMCDQISDLSTAILSASSLRNNPNDGRAQKLAEVLNSLERRIDAMLRAASEPPPSDGSADRIAPELAPEQPRLSAVALPAEAAPPPVEPQEQQQEQQQQEQQQQEQQQQEQQQEQHQQQPAAAAAELPEATLSLPAAAEPEPVKAEPVKPEPASERPMIDLDPISVQSRTASVAAAKPEPPPAPPPAVAQDDEETDDFLLAPLPLPGTTPTPVSEKPADPLAPLRTLSAHELIALFT
jgi:hypothetical protein